MTPIATQPYCTANDLLLGDMPVQSLDLNRFISNAAEEIDAAIGLLYVTPIITDDSAEQRPLKLTLKKINAQLASGRIITSQATGAETDLVHAYGLMLINGALDALKEIATGRVDLPGLTPVNPDNTQGPVIQNQDPSSLVNSFYDFTSPDNGLAVRPRTMYPTLWRR